MPPSLQRTPFVTIGYLFFSNPLRITGNHRGNEKNALLARGNEIKKVHLSFPHRFCFQLTSIAFAQIQLLPSSTRLLRSTKTPVQIYSYKRYLDSPPSSLRNDLAQLSIEWIFTSSILRNQDPIEREISYHWKEATFASW